MSYGTDYLDLPPKQYPIRVERVNKMTKNSTTPEAPKVSKAKSYNKTRGEHMKDMLIVALIVGIAAFIGGMHFSNQQHAEVSKAVSSVQTATAVPVPAKK